MQIKILSVPTYPKIESQRIFWGAFQSMSGYILEMLSCRRPLVPYLYEQTLLKFPQHQNLPRYAGPPPNAGPDAILTAASPCSPYKINLLYQMLLIKAIGSHSITMYGPPIQSGVGNRSSLAFPAPDISILGNPKVDCLSTSPPTGASDVVGVLTGSPLSSGK